MDNPICSICLDEITDKNVTYKLSCNHVFHFTCFKKYVYKTTDSFFTDCPNCKQLNTHIEIPFDDGYKNLIFILNLAKFLTNVSNASR